MVPQKERTEEWLLQRSFQEVPVPVPVPGPVPWVLPSSWVEGPCSSAVFPTTKETQSGPPGENPEAGGKPCVVPLQRPLRVNERFHHQIGLIQLWLSLRCFAEPGPAWRTPSLLWGPCLPYLWWAPCASAARCSAARRMGCPSCAREVRQAQEEARPGKDDAARAAREVASQEVHRPVPKRRAHATNADATHSRARPCQDSPLLLGHTSHHSGLARDHETSG